MRAMAAKTKKTRTVAPSIELQKHAENQEKPPEDDDQCHIQSGDGRTSYCGHVTSGKATCEMYDGEAVCPTCGRPTCPTCATMSDLHWELVKGDDDDS